VVEVVQEILPMTTQELCGNVTRATREERERNKGIIEVFMHVFLDENPVIANYLWLVFGDAFAAEMSNDLFSTTTTTQDPNLAPELESVATPQFFFFQMDEENKEPSKFDKPITALWEEE
jgi:hypothetical protein